MDESEPKPPPEFKVLDHPGWQEEFATYEEDLKRAQRVMLLCGVLVLVSAGAIYLQSSSVVEQFENFIAHPQPNDDLKMHQELLAAARSELQGTYAIFGVGGVILLSGLLAEILPLTASLIAFFSYGGLLAYHAIRTGGKVVPAVWSLLLIFGILYYLAIGVQAAVKAHKYERLNSKR